MFRDGKRLCTLTIILMWGLLLLPLSLFGASTGQVKGKITDKESGEPVIGASVAVDGTKMGTQTDLEGEYVILRLEPGKYTLRITSIRHTTVEVTDVIVSSDLTTEINQELSIKVSDVGIITVIGKQDVIDKFEVSNITKITTDQISVSPVQTVDAILQQVAGVQTSASGEVFIRGGRANEVSYIVDGVPVGDPLGGSGQAGANMSLVSGSISEIQIIKDGFDPEYGNALSGIVKITTLTGSKDNTKMSFQYMTDDFGTKSLNQYSRNFDFVNFTLSGPDPFFKNKLLPALGLNFLEDKEFTYFFYGEVEKHDGIYQHDDFDTPTTGRNTSSFSLLGLDIPERMKNRYYYMSNIKFRPKQNLKFILSYKDSRTQNVYDNTGYSQSGKSEFWLHRYAASTSPVYDERWQSVSLEVSQALSRNMNYEINLSWYHRNALSAPGDPNNPGHAMDPDDFPLREDVETYDDRNDNGVYDAPEPILNLYPDSTQYGIGFWGPGYTYGEREFRVNSQGGVLDTLYVFQLNQNGYYDALEGEPFIDVNGNGVWDQGDWLNDKNGNGILDDDRRDRVLQRTTEPYLDGDVIIGEDYIDVNRNGVYERGIDIFRKDTDPNLNHDVNHDGRYNGPCYGESCEFEPGTNYIDRNGNGIYDAPNHGYDPGEPFTDLNGNGRWDQGGGSWFLDPGSFGDGDGGWNYRSTTRARFEAKVFRQMGNHEWKAGFAMVREKMVYQSIQYPYQRYDGREDGGPFPDRGQFRDMWSYTPIHGTAYIRDKIEYGSMIASLGLRWDFMLQDVDNLVPVAINDDLGSGWIQGDRHKISPRIGFSYPISDKAKVHFNYGHFFQLPGFNFMYARNTNSVDASKVSGDYNLDYMKTIQYSFGVKYALDENYSMDISSYFKDEFDKVAQGVFEDKANHITRNQYMNKDYGRAKGFEFELEKRGGGYVNGRISYTYAFSTGKASQTYESFSSQLDTLPLSEFPLNNDIRHSLKVGLQLYVPKTVKPRVFGLPIPSDWSLTLQAVIESGRPFTPSRDLPGFSTGSVNERIPTNSLRYPSTAVFDIRFNKNFELAGVDMTFILWIENVFDQRNVNSIYSNTGRPDTKENREREINGNTERVIFGGTEFDGDPYNWGYGRQIRFGWELNL